MADLYFEDFKVGDRFVSEGHTLTESNIIDFALKYDPQPFHMDAERAKDSIYGGLIASGWQTALTAFRLFIDTGTLRAASLGAPGVDELRWYAPVYPGDTLHTENEVLAITPSRSKPDRGVVKMRYSARNQRGEEVCSFIGHQMLRRRPA